MSFIIPQTLKISSLSHDGRGIAFPPGKEGGRGKAVFIAGALPGQKVLSVPKEDHGSWREDELLEILDRGGNLAPPLCASAHECGGCPLQSMEYGDQLLWKEKIIKDAMARIGGLGRESLDAAWRGIKPSPELIAFRNKIELAFGEDAEGRPFPGMRKRGSHEVIPVGQCALVDEKANGIVRSFARLLGKRSWPRGFWRFLILRQDQDEEGRKRWHVIAISRPASGETAAKVRALAEELLKERPDLRSFIYETRRDPAKIARGEKRIFSLGEGGTLSMPLGGRDFKIDAASFFQVNAGASEELAKLVKEADAACANKTALLDLYCGAGAPGLLLAPAYSRYMGLELDPRAIDQARGNAAGLPHCSFQAGDAARLIAGLPAGFKKSVSTVLADPPRSGLGKKVVEEILEIAPENIIMVSCNPATLARDARLLSGAYELQSLAGADLFPHTPHVEACALWKRK